nr:hypothetical protein [Tanacetum cinerariifolium]
MYEASRKLLSSHVPLMVVHVLSRQIHMFLPSVTHVFSENLKRIIDSDVFNRCSELSSFYGCLRSQPSVTHVFSENLKRTVYYDALDRFSELCASNVKPRYLPVGSTYESVAAESGCVSRNVRTRFTPNEAVMPDMSKRVIGRPVSTSAVNVGMPIQPVGDGLNEPVWFSKQGVDSRHGSRNVRRRFTPT